MHRRLLLALAAAALAGGPLLLPRLPARDTASGRDLCNADGCFARINGIDVHYTEAGEPDAPAMLLSHHFYGSADTWRKVQPALAERARAIAWDRPGFGLTERPPRPGWNGVNPYTRAETARLGWALLDHLGVEEAVLVGSSAGGTNVLEMYAQQPERVRALVLLSPAITGDVGPPAPLRPLLRTPQARRIGPPLARRLAQGVDVERVARSWYDPSRATDEDSEPYRRMLRVHGWDEGFWEVMTAEPPPDLRELLTRIEVPTLVVTGDADTVVHPELSRRTAAAIPGAQLVELPETGHTPHEERPDLLVTAIGGLLDRLGI